MEGLARQAAGSIIITVWQMLGSSCRLGTHVLSGAIVHSTETVAASGQSNHVLVWQGTLSAWAKALATPQKITPPSFPKVA